MKSLTPYNCQNINQDDINSVIKVLKSSLITQGEEVLKFEKKISDYVKSKYALTFNSATSALQVALLSLNVKKNDIIWTSVNTFVATANAATCLGAKVDFIDINLKDYNLDIDLLEKKLKNSKNNNLPKVVIPVHFAGYPSNMKKLFKLSKIYNFKIIEDASHALGSYHDLNKVGSCKYSDICIFSLHAVKMITTGEGGILSTNNKNSFELAQSLRSHGITRNIKKFKKKIFHKWYYEQQHLGFNYRLTDFQAALGSSQLSRLDFFVKKRNDLANIYFSNLKCAGVLLPKYEEYIKSSFHLFVVRFENKKKRDGVFEFLRKKNIICNFHYIPIYLHPYYQKMNFKKNYCPKSELYFDTALSLPLFVNLKKNKILEICNFIKKFIN